MRLSRKILSKGDIMSAFICISEVVGIAEDKKSILKGFPILEDINLQNEKIQKQIKEKDQFELMDIQSKLR